MIDPSSPMLGDWKGSNGGDLGLVTEGMKVNILLMMKAIYCF